MRGTMMIALAAAMAATPALAAETAQADADKLICKRFLETGSLVRSTKKCFTRAQWDQIAEMERRGWEKTRDDLNSKSQGGP